MAEVTKATIKSLSNIEMSVIAAALQSYRKVMNFNANAIHATDDERAVATVTVTVCENLLKAMSIEPNDLSKVDEKDKVNRGHNE
jgi:hypothetical protein